MRHTAFWCLLLIAGVSLPAAAADFGFTVIIRAGLRNNGDWELGIGERGSNASAATAHLNPYYRDNAPERFEIGYTQNTNTAYVRFYHQAGGMTSVSYNPIGGTALRAGDQWTLPSVYAQATSRPNVNVGTTADQLSLTTGMSVLQGLSATTLTAFAPSGANGVGVTTALASPVVFVSQGGNGDWMLSGRISFLGLSAYNSGGSQRSGSHFSLTASAASNVPEPATAALVATASGLFWMMRRWRQRAQ